MFSFVLQHLGRIAIRVMKCRFIIMLFRIRLRVIQPIIKEVCHQVPEKRLTAMVKTHG